MKNLDIISVELEEKKKINIFVDEKNKITNLQYCGIDVTAEGIYIDPKNIEDLKKISPFKLSRLKYESLPKTEKNTNILNKYDNLTKEINLLIKSNTTSAELANLKQEQEHIRDNILEPQWQSIKESHALGDRNLIVLLVQNIKGLIIDISEEIYNKVNESKNELKSVRLFEQFKKAGVLPEDAEKFITPYEVIGGENLGAALDNKSILSYNLSEMMKSLPEKEQNEFKEKAPGIFKEIESNNSTLMKDLESYEKEQSKSSPSKLS